MKLRLKSAAFSIIPVIVLSGLLIILQYSVFSQFRDDVLYVQANELYESAIALLDSQDRVLTEALFYISQQEPEFGKAILTGMIKNNPDDYLLMNLKLQIIIPGELPHWAEEFLETEGVHAQISKAIDNNRARITLYPVSEQPGSIKDFPDIIRVRILNQNQLIVIQRIDMSTARLSIRFFKEESEKEIQKLIRLGGGLILFFALLLSSAFAFMLTTIFLKPIKALKHIVDDMTTRRSGLRWEKNGEDEFNELGNAFNSMADNLTTYQKQLEALISMRLAELEEARRQAAFGSMMAAGIAHDIKGPLGSLRTALTFLEDQLNSVSQGFEKHTLKSSDLETFLNRTREGINVAVSSVTKAIDLSRSFKDVVADQVKGEIRSIELKSYIDDVVLSYHPRLVSNRVTVECDIPEGLTLRCDPGALSQILINLMENSLVHGFPGEYVSEISDDQWSPVIFIAAEGNDERIEIEYRDNGTGMSQEARKNMFETMYTTRQTQGGTGYGMMMIHDIVVNRLGGEIRYIENEDPSQRGVNFIITIPHYDR